MFFSTLEEANQNKTQQNFSCIKPLIKIDFITVRCLESTINIITNKHKIHAEAKKELSLEHKAQHDAIKQHN